MTDAAKTLGEFLNVPFPPRNPILGTWLVERSLNMLHASPGAGKSLICLAISVEVAGGGQFLQWEAPKARRVLYLDAETDPSDLQERAQSLKAASAMTEEQLKAVDDNLLIWSQHATAEGERMPDLKDDTSEVQEKLERLCRTRGVDLVIVDNLSPDFS